jgi:hypothetical protein
MAFSSHTGTAVVYTPPPFHFGNFSPLRTSDLFEHSGVLSADLNQDGRDDLIAWHDASRRFVVYHAGPTGALELKQVLDIPLGPEEHVIFIRFEAKIADLNSDGRPDLALLEEGTARFLFLETRSDGLLGEPKIWRNSSFTYALDWLALDVNQDGLADLAFSEDDDKFVIAIQRPGFTFERQWWPTSASFPGFEGRGVSSASLDGGPLPDFAWTVRNPKDERRTLLYRNEGQNRFLPGLPLRLNTKTGPYLWGELAPDLNGDQLPDLLQRDERKNSLSVFTASGAPNASEVFRLAHTQTLPIFGSVRWLDLDLDGRLDLLQESPERACYLLNTGKGTLAPAACESNDKLDTPPQLAIRADLNGDSLPDRVLLSGHRLQTSLAGQLGLRLSRPNLPPNPAAAQPWSFQVEANPVYPTFISPKGAITLLRDGEPLAHLPLNTTRASANLILDAGQYELSYSYPGDKLFAASISEKVALLLAPHPTETTLALALANQELKAAIAVKATNATPSGSVSLRRDGLEVASLPLLKGTAVWSTKDLPPGPSTWTAEYVPARNFFASVSAPQSLSITGAVNLFNAFSARQAVAPNARVRLEAKSFTSGVLQIGTLKLTAQSELVLPADTPAGVQNLVLTQGAARWEGRVNVSRLAPGITPAGAYWSQLQNGNPAQSAPHSAAEYFPLTTWLSVPGRLTTLTAFGTGWRNATTASQITATLNNTRLTVLSYGPHDTIPGLDYLTLQIPSTFRPPSAATLTPFTRLQVSAANIASNALDLLLR